MRLNALFPPYAVGVASRLAVQILAFVQIMIASRYLDLADFGSYALGWAACVIVVSFVYTGFYQALLRSTDFEEERHTGFWSMALIGSGGAVVMLLAGLLIRPSNPDAGSVFLALAALPVLRVGTAWTEAHLVRAQRVRLVSSYGMVSETVALVVLLVSLGRGHGLFSLVFARYATLAVEMAILIAATRISPAPRFSRGAFAGLRRTAFPLWGTSALGMFSNYGADLILGAFLNTTAVGAYRGGARISQTAADMVFQPLNTISWSRFSQLEKQNRSHEMRTVWLENMGFGAVLLWPVLMSLAVLSTDLVLFLFDEKWLPAAPIIVILCLSRGVAFLSALLEPTLICRGKGALQMRVRLAGGIVLLATLASFGRFGAEHAAFAHATTSSVVAVLSLLAIVPTLSLQTRDLLHAFAPAAGITVLCYAGLVGTADLRVSLGPTAGLLTAIAALAVFWLAAVAWCLRQKFVALPRP